MGNDVLTDPSAEPVAPDDAIEGRVIGIHSAVATSYGGAQASNIGFAISIERAVEIAGALLA